MKGLSNMNQQLSKLNVALIHERLNVLAGAEKVLCAIHELFPDAPVYTALSDEKLVQKYLPNTRIYNSFLQKIPLIAKHHQKFLPLYMLAFEQFDLSEYDLVISSSHCAAKSVITKPSTFHICYCQSPMRYAWDMQHEYSKSQNKFTRSAWAVASNYVRVWDVSTATRVDHFVANSKYIAKRIMKFYRRPASVIYPPVDIERFHVSPKVDDYYLVVSRFAPYKRIDLVIEAFNQLGRRLVIIGDGEQRNHLKRIAGPNIEFKGYASDEEVAEYMSCCKAFIHAAEEDFGINMVEAIASGRPVIAYGVGGAADIIQDSFNGVLFPKPTVDSLIEAVKRCDSVDWNPTKINESSHRFSAQTFKSDLLALVEQTYKSYIDGQREKTF